MKTITFSELKRKAFCSSDTLNKVIINGIVHEWVGIGFVECGAATDDDKEKHPTVVDG